MNEKDSERLMKHSMTQKMGVNREIKLLLIYVYMVEFYGLIEMENSC